MGQRKPVRFVIVGAGGRGVGYGRQILRQPDRARVVAVAEPRAEARRHVADEHEISAERRFSDWRELADGAPVAEAAIVATQDAMHAEPTIALLERGYHVLLEKPMAPNADDCRRIAEAAQRSGRLFGVCHVLRYTDYTRRLKQVLDDGRIGELVSMQRLEPVGYWHQAHSFVRGHWRNEGESSFMLLAKSCHDIDWIRYVMGRPCERVQSFGALHHFRGDQKPAPAGAAKRCIDCDYEPDCPYSAKKIYLDPVRAGRTGWPASTIVDEVSEVSIEQALRAGPYGRCVYECDNDVVDHQVVNMEFEGGRTASFVMTGFTKMRGRETKLFGTRGELVGDGRHLHLYDFLTEQTETIDTAVPDAGQLGGHGGGDTRLIEAFIDAVAHEDPSRILSGPEETLESHLMCFAAERSRHEGRVCRTDEV